MQESAAVVKSGITGIMNKLVTGKTSHLHFLRTLPTHGKLSESICQKDLKFVLGTLMSLNTATKDLHFVCLKDSHKVKACLFPSAHTETLRQTHGKTDARRAADLRPQDSPLEKKEKKQEVKMKRVKTE